jgi:hypothetical protein
MPTSRHVFVSVTCVNRIVTGVCLRGTGVLLSVTSVRLSVTFLPCDK